MTDHTLDVSLCQRETERREMTYQDHVVSPGDVSMHASGAVCTHIATNPHIYVSFNSIYIGDPICFKRIKLTAKVVVWRVYDGGLYIKYKLSQDRERRYSLRRCHTVHAV